MTDLGWVYRSTFGIKENVALEKALASFGLEFEGRQHDALNDAHNTARVHMAMIHRMRQSPIFLPSNSTLAQV
jgi:inhibitor of KinA sporulation pathway (predicted exonuclease)